MAIIIQDDELRNLFRIEGAEHLQKLDAGLLKLETNPNDTEVLQEIFREAHSLKGAARMLGLLDIQRLSGELEDVLDSVRSKKVPFTAEISKIQLAKLDQIGKLVSDVVGDTQISPSIAAVIAGPEISPINPEIDVKDVKPLEQIHPQSALESINALVDDFHIDTLRVDATRLDFLLAQVGELLVSRSRILRWQTEIDELFNQLQTKFSSDNDLYRLASNLRPRLIEDATRLGAVTGALEIGIRNLRLLPVSTLLEQFPRMVHDLAAEQHKKVELITAGGATVADKRIIEEMKSPLMHMLRNAIDHGIEMPDDRIKAGKDAIGRITVSVSQGPNHVNLVVSDDGRGLDVKAIKETAVKRGLYTKSEAEALDDSQIKALILMPGFSTSKVVTNISGRGVGMDVVRTAIEHMRGSLSIDSRAGKGMTFTLSLPVSLTSTRVILVRESSETYAIPYQYLLFMCFLKPADLYIVEDRQCFYHDDEVITVARLSNLLGGSHKDITPSGNLSCVVLKVNDFKFGLLIDEIEDEQEIVLMQLPAPIQHIQNISGLTILDSGNVCPVVNAEDLASSLHKGDKRLSDMHIPKEEAVQRKTVLLVEDSIVTRIQEKRILEGAGYAVVTANDGIDAWSKLASQSFDVIVSDILMPNMNGLELAEKIRSNKIYSEIPIILVSSLASEDDRRRGLEAGADAYLAKSEFDQDVLLDSIARLI